VAHHSPKRHCGAAVPPRPQSMRGDRHVHESSTVVREDDEYEGQPEGEGRRDEEVGGHDLARAIRQKRAPRFGTVGADAVACIWLRSIDSPRSPASGARRESEGL
jgi:hypothetical protein